MSDNYKPDRVTILLLTALIVGVMIGFVVVTLDVDSKLHDLQLRVGQLESRHR